MPALCRVCGQGGHETKLRQPERSGRQRHGVICDGCKGTPGDMLETLKRIRVMAAKTFADVKGIEALARTAITRRARYTAANEGGMGK